MEQCILMQNYLHFKKTRYSIHDVYVSMAISHSVCHVMTRPSSHPQSRAASKSVGTRSGMPARSVLRMRLIT